MQTTVFIPGIHCASCAALIKDISNQFSAIKNTEIDVDTKIVTLEHNEDFDLQKWTTEIEALDPKYKIHPTP